MAAGSVRSNVYTVLAFIALAALITTLTVVWMRSNELFGDRIRNKPWEVVEPNQISLVEPIDIHQV